MSTYSGQELASGVTSRKRMRTAAPGPSGESTALQSAMREIRELRSERLQERAGFEEQLRQRDQMMHSMEERMRQLQNELSRFNVNDNIRGDRSPENFSASGREGTRDSIELGYKLKPDIFDGSVPLREFFAQFEFIARANCWTEAAKNVALVSCLRGRAREVLECVGENLNYAELKSRLELRFGESHLFQSYYSLFTNRKQKPCEDEATLGSDLERLSQLAYPECPHAVRDKIACAQFVSALSNSFVRRTLQLEGVTSLKVAVQRAKVIKIIRESNFDKQNKFSYEKKGDKVNFKEKGRNDEGDSKSEKKETGKRFNFRERRPAGQKECWQCGKTGHFRAECPSLKGN